MKAFDVMGVSNALLDLIATVDEKFLAQVGFKKAEMKLIDATESDALLSYLPSKTLLAAPGGSAANTAAGVATLGGRSLLIGSLGEDAHGDAYEAHSQVSGLTTKFYRQNAKTGHSIIMVTPDKERTMATHLGAAVQLQEDYISFEDIKASKILHLEAYQVLDESLQEVMLSAIRKAKQENVLISMDLNDAWLINHHRKTLEGILHEFVDIVFANEEEAFAYARTDNPHEALRVLEQACGIVAVKLGEDGSLLSVRGDVHEIPAYKVNMVNTNGAGDAYNAGVLFGITQDLPPATIGRIGSYIGAQVVASASARLERDLSREIRQVISLNQ